MAKRYGNSMREGASYERGERSGKRDNPGNTQYYETNKRPKNTDMVDRGGDRPYMGESSMSRAMQPNNPRGSFIKEDWNEPALLKRGVHEFDVTYHANKHRSGRLGDLYEQVDKTTREDQNAFDSLTDPHNW
jgi:hypothetical protein